MGEHISHSEKKFCAFYGTSRFIIFTSLKLEGEVYIKSLSVIHPWIYFQHHALKNCFFVGITEFR
jgi:hypothetical protein